MNHRRKGMCYSWKTRSLKPFNTRILVKRNNSRSRWCARRFTWKNQRISLPSSLCFPRWKRGEIEEESFCRTHLWRQKRHRCIVRCPLSRRGERRKVEKRNQSQRTRLLVIRRKNTKMRAILREDREILLERLRTVRG